MDWIYFLVLLLTHTAAYWMGMQAQTEKTDERVEMYDVYLKWEHEKWMEERRDHRDHN